LILLYEDKDDSAHFSLQGNEMQIYTGQLPCLLSSAAWIMEPFTIQIDWDMPSGADILSLMLEQVHSVLFVKMLSLWTLIILLSQTQIKIVFTYQDYKLSSVVLKV